MSAHSVDGVAALIPSAVLVASLLGSGHCVAMCGGFAFAVVPGRASLIQYHLGRLISYSALGALAGWLGRGVLSASAFQYVPWAAQILLALGFVTVGARIALGKPLHWAILPKGLTNAAARVTSRAPHARGLLLGLFSALLPCGWLHTFVLGAVATGDPATGALSLAAFWLGTVPALSFAPLLIQRIFGPMAKKLPVLSGVILILVGVGSLAYRGQPLGIRGGTPSERETTCPHHSAPRAEGRHTQTG